MQVFGMQLIHHLFGLGIILLIELHRAPAVFAPVLPVLNQRIAWNFSLSEFGSDIENFLLAVIPLPTLQVTVGPLRKQRRLPGKLTVVGDDTIQLGAIKKVVA